MRELHYVNGIMIVSPTVCDAVFTYSAALARAGEADVVTVPILWHGERGESNLVLTPASQLYCTPSEVTDVIVDLDDEELVIELRLRTARLGPRLAVAMEEASIDSTTDPLDEDCDGRAA